MRSSFAEAAARNNAEWCDLISRSHGLSTRWAPALRKAGRLRVWLRD